MTAETRFASGAVIFNDANKILLVTSSKDRQQFVLPKGGVEPGLTNTENAVKEAAEEAGVMFIYPPLSQINEIMVQRGTITQYESYFLGRFITYCEWPESGMRNREWFSPSEAIARLDDRQGAIVARAVQMWAEYRDGREYDSAIHIAGAMHEMGSIVDAIRNHAKIQKLAQQSSVGFIPTGNENLNRLFESGIEPGAFYNQPKAERCEGMSRAFEAKYGEPDLNEQDSNRVESESRASVCGNAD